MQQSSIISVAMCTFNGGKYLNEQLRSLLQQEVVPKELVVGDDGSTDDTIDLLRRFSYVAPFPVHIIHNAPALGFQDNFLSTASRCIGDWVAFCDQDDIWLPNKLADIHTAIRGSANDVCLYLQVSYICNAQLEHSGRVFPRKVRHARVGANRQSGFWVWPGFLQTFRADLVRSFSWRNRPNDFIVEGRIQSHDQWICMVGNALGNVEYLPKPAALFRRHELAISGTHDDGINNSGRRSIDRIVKQYERLSRLSKQSSDCLGALSSECADYDASRKLDEAANLFCRLSDIYRLRLELITEANINRRFTIYLKLLEQWGWGHVWLQKRGWLSLGKDLARVFIKNLS